LILALIHLPPEYLDARLKFVNSKLFGNSYSFLFVINLNPHFILLFRIEAFYLSTLENKVPIKGINIQQSGRKYLDAR